MLPLQPRNAAQRDLVAFGARLDGLSEAEIDELFASLAEAHERAPTEVVTMRLALLHAYPASRHYEPSRALTLLTSLPSGGGAVDEEFTGLLVALLRGREVLERAADAQRVPTAAESRIAELEVELARAVRALATEQERGAELERQLDALIDLEVRLDAPAASGGSSSGD